MPLTIGQMLQARYRIVALLGQGGMGAVYRAWDTRLDKPVALKEAVPQPGLDADTLARYRVQFRQEAVTLGRLAHPHLVPVTDYFAEQANDYLVMAFVDGENLAERIRRDGALSETQVLRWAAELLDALAYCHEQGVIHRDIKPQNVIITSKGSAVLVDFGLVKLWDPSDPQTRTVMRGMGTPEYAPPEQWGAMGYHTDPRSDLYSLGATLYHALTGQAPPTASDRMVYPEQYRTPRELNGKVSPTVDAAISRAMVLAINARWPDAAAMAGALAEGRTAARTTPGSPSATAVMPGVTAAATATPEPALGAPPLLYPAEAQPEPQAPPSSSDKAPAGPGPMPEPAPAPARRRGRVPVWAWLVGAALSLGGLAVASRLSGFPAGVWPAPTATARVPARVPATERPMPRPTATGAAPTNPEPPEPRGPAQTVTRVGLVTDINGVDDKSFNAASWAGVERAIKELGVEGSYLESHDAADFAPNIQALIDQDTDLIITMGYMLADDTAKLAQENPEQAFAIVDTSYDHPIENVRVLTFATDQASFLAGYVAAAATKTGTVACYGGMNIWPVVEYLVGYEAGVALYNEQHGTKIEVLGWNTAADDGLFADTFSDTARGYELGKVLIDRGADVILPVAGPVGTGTAQMALEYGKAWVIGVDTDWTVNVPQVRDVVLTSVLKRMDIAVYDTIAMVVDPGFRTFGGEVYMGTIGNGGVDIAEVAAGAVSAEALAELGPVREQVAKGEIDTGWAAYLANHP